MIRKIFPIFLSFLNFAGFVLSSDDILPDVPKGRAPLRASDLASIRLSSEIGFVQEVHTSSSNPLGKMIIYIQDAHCHFQAQMNIAKILENLMSRYTLSLVAVEGTAGLIDTTSLAGMGGKASKEKILQYFMKKGKITGPEYLSIMRKYFFTLYGIEDEKVYDQNVAAFQKLWPYHVKIQKTYRHLQKMLDPLKEKIYSKRIKFLAGCWDRYHSGEISFVDFSKTLSEEFEKKDGIKDDQSKLGEKCPTWMKFLEEILIEKKINLKSLEDEERLLIKKLSPLLSKDEMKELISAQLQVRLNKKEADSFAFFLEHLLIQHTAEGETLLQWKMDFPQVADYFEFEHLHASLDQPRLLEELDLAASDLLEKLFENADQRKLFQIASHLALLKKFCLLESDRTSVSYYKAYAEEFHSNIFFNFISEKIEQYHLASRFSEEEMEVLDRCQILAEKFYDRANERDRILVEHTLKAMDEYKVQTAFMITGGYHQEGVKALLKEQGISYIILSPKISEDQNPHLYLDIICHQKSAADEFRRRRD